MVAEVCVLAPRPLNRRPLTDRALGLLALAIVYFALAKLGLALASLHPSASPIWPPSGLALAAFLLWGNRVWPAVGAAAFLANATTFGSVGTSLAIAAGNTAEAMLTAWLLKRWSDGADTFRTPAGVARFAGLALAPGTMVSATVGVGSLVLAGHADAAKATGIWTTWWLGDVGGQIIVAPAIVLWATAGPLMPDRAEVGRLAALLAATVAVGVIAFSPLLEQTPLRGPLAFLAIAPMLWAALRFELRHTATAALVLSAFAVWGTLANGGPFAGPSLNESFLLTLTFVISTAVPSLVLSADAGLRQESEARQRLLVRELQHRTRNMLAVIQSIVSNTLLRSRDPDEARDAIMGRLQALARAQQFVSAGPAGGVPLRDLVEAELEPFAQRLSAEGPPLVIGGAFAQMFALVLHELATNAAKYGSLSVPSGRLLVRWDVAQREPEPELTFAWTETGGPPASPPAERGFGSELIGTALGTTPRIAFAPDGLVFEITLPMSAIMKPSRSATADPAADNAAEAPAEDEVLAEVLRRRRGG
jgi:two-component sensor histidine kinase